MALYKYHNENTKETIKVKICAMQYSILIHKVVTRGGSDTLNPVPRVRGLDGKLIIFIDFSLVG